MVFMTLTPHSLTTESWVMTIFSPCCMTYFMMRSVTFLGKPSEYSCYDCHNKGASIYTLVGGWKIWKGVKKVLKLQKGVVKKVSNLQKRSSKSLNIHRFSQTFRVHAAPPTICVTRLTIDDRLWINIVNPYYSFGLCGVSVECSWVFRCGCVERA